MKIKIENPPAEDLRRDYIKARRESDKFEALLRDMAKSNRAEYEQYIARIYEGQVKAFLSHRAELGNRLTVEQINTPAPQGKGESDRDYEQRRYLHPRYDPELVYALTDHPAKGKAPEGEFPVRLRMNHKAVALSMAADAVERIVDHFVFKSLDKVIDILVAKPDYEVALVKNSYSSGALEADVRFDFADGTGFRTHLIVKTNSRSGFPYTQYPMTFHDATLRPGGPPKAATSMDAVERAWGVKAWVPPPTPKRWESVSPGCVVLAKDGRLGLVERVAIPKDLMPELKKAQGKAKRLCEAYEGKRQLLQDPRAGSRTDRKSYQEADRLYSEYHKFYYEELPAIRASLERAFVLFPDDFRSVLAPGDVARIAAKITVSPAYLFGAAAEAASRNPADVPVGMAVIEYADGRRIRSDFRGAAYTPQEWNDLPPAQRKAVLWGRAFQKAREEMGAE